MKCLCLPFTVFLILLSIGTVRGQLDSIYDQGVYRTYIVHLPPGYNSAQEYPLVLNLHGLNSNAAQQQNYTQMDAVADTSGLIMVYPNGVNNSWQVNGTIDVDFLQHLIDTVRSEYSTNNCLFAMGMSDGAFMTYKLACAIPATLTAIAVVSGNMSNFLQNNCAVTTGLPLLHIHGTADSLVNFNGTFGIPPVDTTIQFWVQNNQCNSGPVYTQLPDLNLGDSCSVETFDHLGGINGSRVWFFRVLNGGHTWPGATPAPPLGNTNQDFSASVAIGAFFKSYCPLSTSLAPQMPSAPVTLFPNPAQTQVTVQSSGPEKGDLPGITIRDLMGKVIWQASSASEPHSIRLEGWPRGIYIVSAKDKTLRLAVN